VNGIYRNHHTIAPAVQPTRSQRIRGLHVHHSSTHTTKGNCLMSYRRYKDTPVMNGNKKLGSIPNVSLLPIDTCINNSFCKDDCYAVKFVKLYTSVRNMWSENTDLAKKNPEAFFNGIRKALIGLTPEFFRIHVSGDFFSQDYFDMWCDLARDFPATNFLAFTKAYKFMHKNRQSLPENLEIVLSIFPGLDLPLSLLHYPVAAAGTVGQYEQSHRVTPERISDAVHCPGNCSTCSVCWSLAKKNLDVRFSIH